MPPLSAMPGYATVLAAAWPLLDDAVENDPDLTGSQVQFLRGRATPEDFPA
jgi:hypothetical protein